MGQGETTRELRAGMPADQVGAPLERDLGRVNACSRVPRPKGERGWGWGETTRELLAGIPADQTSPPPKGASRGWGGRRVHWGE